MDSYASLSEMTALVSLVGPQGVRVIETRLLETVRVEVEKMKTFLERCQKPLRELKDGYVAILDPDSGLHILY